MARRDSPGGHRHSADGKAMIASDTTLAPKDGGDDAGRRLRHYLGRRRATGQGGAEPTDYSRHGFRPPHGSASSKSPFRPHRRRRPKASTWQSRPQRRSEKLPRPPRLTWTQRGIRACTGPTPSTFVYVMSGRCVARVGGRREDRPRPRRHGLVQNGVRHAWSVPGDTPCRVLCVSIGGARKG